MVETLTIDHWQANDKEKDEGAKTQLLLIVVEGSWPQWREKTSIAQGLGWRNEVVGRQSHW